MWTTIGARLLNLFLRNLVCVWALLNHLDFLSAVAGILILLVVCGIGVSVRILVPMVLSVLDYLV